jgi:translocation and assembly module TamA
LISRHLIWLVLIAVSLVPAIGAGSAAAQSTAPLHYVTRIDGQMPEDLRALLEEVSQTRQFQDREVASLAMLRRRLQDDRDRLLKALRSRGFYDAAVEGQVDEAAAPVAAVLTVETGPVYLIEAFAIERTGAAGDPAIAVALADIGIEIGMPAEASRLKAAEDAILAIARRAGYPAPRIAEARHTVDHDRTTLSTQLLLEPGQPATFGALSIEGLDQVRESYVRVLANWRVDRPYDPDVLKDLKTKMNETGVFSTVLVDAGDVPDETGRLPVTLKVEERDRRTVALGLRVTSSDEFLSANAVWQHRNFFGGGETVKAETTVSSLKQEAVLSFRKPEFLKRGQTFAASTTARHEDSDAFEESSLSGLVALERQSADIYTTSVGLAGELSSMSDSRDDSYFALLGVPLGFIRDTRDSPLDATTGTRFTATTTPWASLSESSSGFVVGEVSAAAYQMLGTPRAVAAARVRFGSILADDLRDVPANKRFYAGGGSSIRGYEFRRVGPLDSNGDPTGGRSVAEVGAEIRLLVTETIGVVPFVDGGQVYKTTLPGFDEDLRWAAGLGLRYVTPIGPIRLDVAFPLDRRDGIDDRFQFYISIGQAF